MANSPKSLNVELLKRNKRIAKNTFVLFGRMFFITIINLYTVRLTLKALGVIDYGIYNTIAGVVTSTAFLSSVLALSIQRFYSFALGENKKDTLNDIFSISINIALGLSCIIFVFFETFGLWFLHTYLTIPPERMHATIWLYEFSLFSFIFSLIQIPYTAAVFSHEDMGMYAIISTFECLLKLISAILLNFISIEHLIFYGASNFIISIIIFICYFQKGRKHYPECTYQKVKNKSLYKKITSFGGWTLYGSLASTSMGQGCTIIINIFWGPFINAALGIAQQVNIAFGSLTNTLLIPFRPAMIKAYAEKNFDYLNSLFYASNKFVMYILLIVSVPMIIEMETIITFWLGETNEITILFCKLMIVYTSLLAMHNPITIIMHATGHVKEYHLPVESITILCLPITWLFYMLGQLPYYVFISMIICCIIAHIVRVLCLLHFYKPFSLLHYIRNIFIPGMLIFLCLTFAGYNINTYIQNTYAKLALAFLGLPITTIILAYTIGLNQKEKQFTQRLVKKIARI